MAVPGRDMLSPSLLPADAPAPTPQTSPPPPQHDPRSKLRWLQLSCVNQVVWGMYPACAGLLQRREGVSAFALLTAALSVVLPLQLLSMWVRGTLAELKDTGSHPVASLCFCAVLVVRTLTNAASAGYGEAAVLQLVNLSTPFLTTLMAKVMLPATPPLRTADAAAMLAATAAGITALVPSLLREGAHGADNVKGAVLQLISTCALSLYLVTLSKARGMLGADCLIVLQFGSSLTTSVAVSAALGEVREWPGAFGGLWRNWEAAAAFSFFTLVAYFVGNNLQVAGVRAIGPSLWTLPLSLRLVVAIASGYLMLGEELSSFVQWIGAALVVVFLSVYLLRLSQRADKARAGGDGRAAQQQQQAEPAVELSPLPVICTDETGSEEGADYAEDSSVYAE
eukprot:TRINITY_DN21880_c0_g1_i1.p1 TRINITY_DN21880_c0_g1~~TRINITY_DN21880_c0_g1_i1.p1  ORF type:complete len:414 (+),score=157.75 TRINITY_DN21880_c0_g1_i1:55-1242(+)